VTAVAYVPGVQGNQVFGTALVHVLPEPPAHIALDPRPARLVAGSRLTLSAIPFSRHGDRRADPVTFTSSNARCRNRDDDGRLRAVAAGRATITATAGPATETLALQVLPNNIARVTIEPGTSNARTGDVVKFTGRRAHAAGLPVGDVAVDWAVSAGSGVSEIDPSGTFVAELAGDYTVTASIGGKDADAVVTSRHGKSDEASKCGVACRSDERSGGWVHPSGTCAYLSTIADRVYAIDITDVSIQDRGLDDDERAHRQRRDDDRGRKVPASFRARARRTARTASSSSMRATLVIPSRSPSTRRPSRAASTAPTSTRGTRTSPTTRRARCA